MPGQQEPASSSVIGTMPMSTLAAFSGMSIDHDTLDELALRWQDRDPTSRTTDAPIL